MANHCPPSSPPGDYMQDLDDDLDDLDGQLVQLEQLMDQRAAAQERPAQWTSPRRKKAAATTDSNSTSVSVVDGDPVLGAPKASAKKKAKADDALPKAIADIDLGDIDRFVFGEKMPYIRGKSNKYPRVAANVLTHIKARDGCDDPDVEVETLSTMQLRSLGKALGVTGSSHESKWDFVVKITEVIRSNDTLASKMDDLRKKGQALAPTVSKSRAASKKKTVPKQKAADRPKELDEDDQQRWNSITRLCNILFTEPRVYTLLTLNDARNRKEQEEGIGAKAQHFWRDVAEQFQPLDELEDPDPFGELDESLTTSFESYAPAGLVAGRFQEGQADPSNYISLDSDKMTKVVELWFRQLNTVRAAIVEQRGTTGNHTADWYGYIEPHTHEDTLKDLGMFPIYYFLLFAARCEGFETKFSKFLLVDLAATSEPSTNDEEVVEVVWRKPAKKRTSTSSEDQASFQKEYLSMMGNLVGAVNTREARTSRMEELQVANATRQMEIQEREAKFREWRSLVEMQQGLQHLPADHPALQQVAANTARLSAELFPPTASVATAAAGAADGDDSSSSSSDG